MSKKATHSWSKRFPNRANKGPIVRISPYELHIHDPAFFGQLYRHDGTWEKYAWVQRAFAAGPRSTFITSPHDIHRKRRAPLDLFLSKANVARRQHIVSSHVDKLHHRIRDAASRGDTFDLGDALAATGTDIGTEYILGTSFNNLDRPDFNMPMTNMIRAHGGMWRTTKHITFLAPILLAMSLDMLEKVSGQESREFVAFLRVGRTLWKLFL